MFNPRAFSFRVALLVVGMLTVALVDLYCNGSKATRFRQYSFILLAGLLGASVGLGNDLITSSISPDYFILGKGLEEGPRFRMEAALFGLQEGFSAGVIGGAICLYVSQRTSSRPVGKFSTLFQTLWMPVLGAILGAIVLPLIADGFDPARFTAQLNSLLRTEQINQFRRVWWIHIGLYTGMILGLTTMIIRLVKERKSPGHFTAEKEPCFSESGY